jgi:hypothetical protein
MFDQHLVDPLIGRKNPNCLTRGHRCLLLDLSYAGRDNPILRDN